MQRQAGALARRGQLHVVTTGQTLHTALDFKHFHSTGLGKLINQKNSIRH